MCHRLCLYVTFREVSPGCWLDNIFVWQYIIYIVCVVDCALCLYVTFREVSPGCWLDNIFVWQYIIYIVCVVDCALCLYVTFREVSPGCWLDNRLTVTTSPVLRARMSGAPDSTGKKVPAFCNITMSSSTPTNTQIQI